MMEKQVNVSIIMPSLNVAPYIKECLQSALEQTMQEIEIICIDAHSTDGTYEILKEYADEPKYKGKIRLLQSDIKSYGYQVNLGIREAKGKYIAILETDDFVAKEMYGDLYRLAEENQVDFVKADHDTFFELQNGERLYWNVPLWSKEKNYYNKILDARTMTYLYTHDFNIWKGIYNREFLLQNEIWCNESKGAAFQDLGFGLQVLATAKNAYYTDNSYYRYRSGRDESSVNSINGLKYAYQEFQRLLNEPNLCRKVSFKKGLYLRMAYAIWGEYSKVLYMTAYDRMSENVKPYYEWFRKELLLALEKGIIEWDEVDEFFRKDLEDIIYQPDVYVKELKKKRENELAFYAPFDNKNIYVFGAGKKGKWLIQTLFMRGYWPVLVCDNDERLWGGTISTIHILSPEECAALYKKDLSEKIFVIANKNYSKDMERQLLSYGISQEDIINCS